MSPTRTSQVAPGTWIAETIRVPRTSIHPNSWNVNRQNAFQYAKLLESIQQYGFLDPLLCRACVLHGDYEIVGGEHRWRAAGDLGIDILPVVVKEMDDKVARKISLIDNELHGQADPRALSELLKELMDGSDPLDMLRGLPYTDDILKSLVGFTALPPLPAAPRGPEGPGNSRDLGAAPEKWVERTYRMPEDVAKVLDEAIEAAKRREGQATGTEIQTFTALEILAAEFLAS